MAPPPLSSLRVLELAGLAPAPYCGLLLSQYGATNLRIDRPIHPNHPPPPSNDNLTTYKSSLPLDLKSPASRTLFLKLISKSDVLIDPFRPGVLEKLGLHPTDVLLKLNPRLIIVRLTGFRKDGKYKDMAGHDINYLAVSGVLSVLGGKHPVPVPPANLLADFAGGGLVAFAGVLLALISRGVSGKGQVVDANMVDGTFSLGTFPRLLMDTPMWNDPRGENTLDGGAPYYGVYECKEKDTHVAVGALEDKFFKELLRGLGLKEEDIVPKKGIKRTDKRSWEFMRGVFDKKFKERTRGEWEKMFDGTDACVTPVLKFGELREQGYEARPMVGLETSPGIVPGGDEGNWDGKMLQVGSGGKKVLKEWLGWRKGVHWEIDESGTAVVKGAASKL